MLKSLFRHLQGIFLTVFVIVITLILMSSFSRHFDAQKLAELTLIQRMASLLSYDLTEDSENASKILSTYEKEMSIYSCFTDENGEILYKSDTSLPTTIESLLAQADDITCTSSSAVKEAADSPAPIQSGGMELTGKHHDHYIMVSSQIPVYGDQTYHLTILTRQTSIGELFLQHLPAYGTIWLLSLLLFVFLIRWILKKAFAPTEQVLKSHRNFIAAASHELKAPLAVIMSNAELLQSCVEKSSKPFAIASTIDAECSRMSHLIKDLLFLASSDANQQKLYLTEVEIDTLLFSLYEAFEPLCMKKKLRLIPDFSSESYPHLDTDAERLFQLLSIFMDNAISYSPEKGTIELQAVWDGKELVFSVADHGPGISREDAPFIFDRFYCADLSRTEKQHFGLGLSIAKELAKLLEGTIGFSETDGGGATFYLRMPLRQ